MIWNWRLPPSAKIRPQVPAQKKFIHPRLPDGLRYYIVPDIHGRVDLLDDLLYYIEADQQHGSDVRCECIFLGDYIDRGPESSAVIDRLVAWAEHHPTRFLKGNHEALLAGFLQDPESFDQWARCGGITTLMSYGLRPLINTKAVDRHQLAEQLRLAMPEHHDRFLTSLQISHTAGDYFFVHAGVRPGTPIDAQRESDMLWIREEFLQHDGHYERMIIHGHTPVLKPDVRRNRVNLDTGAYATGFLSCLVLQERTSRFL